MILHISYPAKFLPEYRDFIGRHFNSHQHHFLFLGSDGGHYIEASNCYFMPSNLTGYLKLFLYLLQAKKIILHGLFSEKLMLALTCIWWLPSKCYWVVWGGDLYGHLTEDYQKPSIAERLKKFIIPRLSGVITYLEGDFQRAKEWYGARSPKYHCIAYLSNVYRGDNLSFNVATSNLTELLVMVGNSADPSNCHTEILHKLNILQESANFKLICPLSYGDQSHALQVKALGESLFDEKFKALINFMPLNEYMQIIESIDIAVFAHKRQQAMGNTLQLLGAGKKLVIRRGTAQYELFSKLGVSFQTFEDFTLEPLSPSEALKNHKKIRTVFAETRLVEQWRAIFNA